MNACTDLRADLAAARDRGTARSPRPDPPVPTRNSPHARRPRRRRRPEPSRASPRVPRQPPPRPPVADRAPARSRPRAPQSRFAGSSVSDDVGFRPAPRRRSHAVPRDGDRRAVDLAKQQQPLADPRRSRRPPPPTLLRRHAARGRAGEEVVGDRRAAARHRSTGSPRRLRPLETVARLGMNHEYPRTWVRRHRHPAHRARSSSGTAIVSSRACSPTARLPIVRGAANPVPHLAGRFAAKEAAMKALGTGHSRGVLWKDIEVFRHGRPAATAVARRRRGAAPTRCRSQSLAAHHHAFRGAGDGAGPAARMIDVTLAS